MDGWTYELVVLQGQIVIRLLLSRATVSEPSALSLFHHILHINKIARGWSEGNRRKEMRRRERTTQRTRRKGKKMEKDRANTNWSFGGEISHSHPGWMDECLWWPLQVQGGRVSENKRNWFGPLGKGINVWGAFKCPAAVFLQGCGGCLKFEGSWKWQLNFLLKCPCSVCFCMARILWTGVRAQSTLGSKKLVDAEPSSNTGLLFSSIVNSTLLKAFCHRLN